MEKQRKSKHKQEEFTEPVEAYDEQPETKSEKRKERWDYNCANAKLFSFN